MKHLRLFDEFMQRRDNKKLNLIQDELQKVLNGNIGGVAQVFPFVERHQRSIAAIHFHGSIRVTPAMQRFDYCASVENLPSARLQSIAKPNVLVLSNSRPNKIQVSVLVNVREMVKESQTVPGSTFSTIVWLHTLNDRKRLVGNPRKFAVKTISTKRGHAVVTKNELDRKLTVLAPLGGRGCNVRIPLDEVERQMIEGGPHLVDHFPSKNRDLSGRRPRDVQLPHALRLCRDFVRLSSGINGDAVPYSAKMFRSPNELEFCRLNPADHAANHSING
jgi:hypothetical protein